MSEPMQAQAVEPRPDGTGARSSIPPRPTTKRPPSPTTPKAPPASAVAPIAATLPQVPSMPQVRGSTPPPLPVRASVLPPLPLLPLRAALAVPSNKTPAPPPSAAPTSGSDDTREELRRLVGQANEALVTLQTAIREIERRLTSLDARTAPRQPAPEASDKPGSDLGAAGSALRRLASRLIEAVGRLARSRPAIGRLHVGGSGGEGRGIVAVAVAAAPRELERPSHEMPG